MVVGGVAGRVGFLLGVQRHRRSAGPASSGGGGRDDLTSRGNTSHAQPNAVVLTPPALDHSARALRGRDRSRSSRASPSGASPLLTNASAPAARASLAASGLVLRTMNRT